MRARPSVSRLLPVFVFLALSLAACGNDDGATTSDSTIGAAPNTTFADATVPDSTETADSTETTDPNADATTVPASSVSDAGTPLVLKAPVSAGTGLIEAWSDDGQNLVVLAEDAKLSQDGCEGVPEPVLFVQPVQPVSGDGPARRPAYPSDVKQNGSLSRGPNGRVALVQGCEGYLSSIAVATQNPDGTLTELRTVDTDDSAIAELSGQSGLTLDGTALLLTGSTSDETGKPGAKQVTVNLNDGNVEEIAVGARGGRRIAAASGQRYVVGNGTAVDLVRPDGSVERSYDATDFDVSRDGTTLALVKPGSLWVLPVGAEPGVAIALPKQGSSAPTFSPDGKAVGLIGESESDATTGTGGWVVVVRGGHAHLVEEGAVYGRLTWNTTSNAIAYNRFPPDFSKDEIRLAASA